MSILMNSRTDELAEARVLLAALGRCELRNAGERRFLESWRGYLNRTGDDAAIGKWRLQVLRRVAQSYGIGQADEAEQAQVIDLLI
jgi:hypothetical protein